MGTCRFFPVQAVELLCWCQVLNFVNFPFLNTVFVHVSNPNSVLITSHEIVTVCSCVWRSVFFFFTIGLKSSVLAKCGIVFVICSSYPLFSLFYCSTRGINVMKVYYYYYYYYCISGAVLYRQLLWRKGKAWSLIHIVSHAVEAITRTGWTIQQDSRTDAPAFWFLD